MSYLLKAAAAAIRDEAREIENDADNVAVPRELIGLLVGALSASPNQCMCHKLENHRKALMNLADAILGEQYPSVTSEGARPELWHTCEESSECAACDAMCDSCGGSGWHTETDSAGMPIGDSPCDTCNPNGDAEREAARAKDRP